MRTVIVLFFLFLFAWPAEAQVVRMPCGTHESITKQLLQKYSEKPVAVGVTGTGSLIEVLASRDGETWTILLRQTSGLTCIMSSGEDWSRRVWEPAESAL